MTTPDTTRNRRIKPTLETAFHIDYEWWERDARELRVYLISLLPPEKQALFAEGNSDGDIDWIDPDTAEVTRLDALQQALQEVFASEDFLTANVSMVDAIFRVFLVNKNVPLTPIELSEKIGHPPQKILRTISGTRVYKGIRPVLD